jgi:hypothetical protein
LSENGGCGRNSIMSFHVESHLPRLIHSLEHDKPIIGKGKGRFDESCWYWSNQKRLISIAKTFYQAIDQIEKSYRVVSDSNWIKAGNLITEKLSGCQSAEAEKVMRLVQQRLCGLKYRAEVGKERPLSDDEKLQLLTAAMKWKDKQRHFDVRSWQGEDQQMIDELARCHPAFSRLLLKDPSLCNRFFNWTIRDRMRVAQFVLFPKTMELFEKLRVSPAFSKMGARKLRMSNDTRLGIKYLSYPVYAMHDGTLFSKQVKVWDKTKEFEFQDGFKATLRDIYRAMRVKHKHWVDFIISENGYENWNPAEWGRTDERGVPKPIELEKDRWFWQVPVTERLSLEEAKKLYGDHLDGSNFGIALRASRRNSDLDFNGAHSFIELCIPDEEGGYFTITPGKFTRILPTSFFDLLLMLGNTMDAVVVSHDHSAFYPWRQQTRFSLVVNNSDFLWFAENIRQSILQARKGNFVFSALPDSCSTWSQELMNELLERVGLERENFFTMSLLDSDPKGLFGILVYLTNFLPKFLQKFVVRFVIFLFLPWRSKTVYDSDGNPHKVSALNSRTWKNFTFNNPAYLFDRQMRERVLLPSGDLPEWLQ